MFYFHSWKLQEPNNYAVNLNNDAMLSWIVYEYHDVKIIVMKIITCLLNKNYDYG